MRARCGFSATADASPASNASCTFSQRQGFISVRIDGGRDFEFSPTGDAPGNYVDQQGKSVYRLAGLGDAGQLFRLPDSHLYVFWDRDSWRCDRQQIATPGQCTLRHDALGFDVEVTGERSLSVRSTGLSPAADELLAELDGTAYQAELADLDADGWPEIYVYVSSTGSGSYGSLIAFAVNQGKSLSPIYLPPLKQTPEAVKGYMGHDEFAVVENNLVRRFPIYAASDTNAAASAGTRQLQYRLEKGEAGWVLAVDRVVEF
ncbi:PliI family lysozyme inhibitor of I-type lysozyme [Halioglobus maricola]|nr:PliI family lysozyme inhibitor of I-type lysozyme [Halioglobus maricola]